MKGLWFSDHCTNLVSLSVQRFPGCSAYPSTQAQGGNSGDMSWFPGHMVDDINPELPTEGNLRTLNYGYYCIYSFL